MAVLEDKRKQPSSYWLHCSAKWFHMPSWSCSNPSSLEKEQDQRDVKVSTKRKPGGWKAMPFILGLSLSLSHTHTHKITHISAYLICSRLVM
jgi:hypothetical protein